MFGHWAAIFLPVMILNLLGVFIIWYRIDDLPSLEELFIHTLATALSIIVVHFNSVACFIMGQRSWFIDCNWIGALDDFYPTLASFTTVVAGLSGVGVDDLSSAEYVKIDGFMDLLSPNGLYHHILEMPLDDVDRGMSPWNISIAAIVWSVVPVYLLTRRLERIHP